MLTDLKKKIAQNSGIIDEKISKYFASRLGVNDVKTIEALGSDGYFTLAKKIELFCNMMRISKIDKAKFKVYVKVNNEVKRDNRFLFDNYLSNLDHCHQFLFNTYLTNNDIQSVKEKLIFAIDHLIDDVVRLTTHYIEKPQIYYNKEVGILLPE